MRPSVAHAAANAAIQSGLSKRAAAPILQHAAEETLAGRYASERPQSDISDNPFGL